MSIADRVKFGTEFKDREQRLTASYLFYKNYS